VFAKLAQFRPFPRVADYQPESIVEACNDNRPNRRVVAPVRPLHRPVLVCGWHVSPAGRIECNWHHETEQAAEEPGISRPTQRLWLRLRLYTVSPRPSLPQAA